MQLTLGGGMCVEQKDCRRVQTIQEAKLDIIRTAPFTDTTF